jgi:3-phosphoshikimate 1-carboxyvinyltransferase
MPTRPTVLIQPAKSVIGTLGLPGDKSISHRYAMLAAIADGSSRLENYSTGQDCASTLNCIRAVGCQWKHAADAPDTVIIQGCGPTLHASRKPLDCGNSGSTMRMLSGILAGQSFTTTLIGDKSLSRRPMARVIKPLAEMGAKISAGTGDRPPLKIKGGHLKPISYKMPVASAQVKSAVLFAGLFAEGETTVEETIRTRDHTEVALRAFGAEVKRTGNAASIKGGQKLRALDARIPGDTSSAAFFLCAAALFPDSQLTLVDLLMNPTRARLLDILAQMGLSISVTNLEDKHGELVGTIQVEGGELLGTTISGADSAMLIDELPVLAAIAPYTRDGVEIKDAKELRVKESDRITAVATNLRAMGAEAEELEDGLKISGGQSLHGTQVDSFGDHRIAMAFAIAALRAEGDTLIQGSDAAVISYPAFYDALASIAQR